MIKAFSKAKVLSAVLAIGGMTSLSALALTIGDTARLPDCQGTVSITKSEQQGKSGKIEEQINIVFKGVKLCSNFDILGANGRSVGYESKKLELRNDGSYGASMTIPKKLIDSGFNDLHIVVKSNSNKATGMRDDIPLEFYKTRSGRQAPVVELPDVNIPSQPSHVDE
jgi:hypothetical protein